VNQNKKVSYSKQIMHQHPCQLFFFGHDRGYGQPCTVITIKFVCKTSNLQNNTKDLCNIQYKKTNVQHMYEKYTYSDINKLRITKLTFKKYN